MKFFKGLAILAHTFSLFMTMCAGIVAVMGLVPNKPLAWIIFMLATTSGIATWALFFTKNRYWYDTHESLINKSNEFDENLIELHRTKQNYLRKIEVLDQVIGENKPE